MKRLNRTVLAALTGVATGLLAWNFMVKRRRRIGQRRSAAMVPGAAATPVLSAPFSRDDEDARLDEAIEESFPASDPVSIRIE